MVIVLFLVNLIAVEREHSAKAAAAQALEMADSTNKIALSDHAEPSLPQQLPVERRQPGSGAHERRRTRAERILCRLAQKTAISDQQRSALDEVQKNESAWVTEFAQPMLQKRREVDAGNATVADLQIYYLQKDASAWVKTSTDSLECCRS